MPFPSDRSYFGIAKEVTKGTGVVPTDYVPLDPAPSPTDRLISLPDNGLRGSMVDNYDNIAGPLYSEYSFGGDVFADTIGYFISSLTGDVVTVGGSAPFTHTFAPKNTTDGQGVSLSLSDYYGMGATTTRRFPGLQVQELTFKFDADGKLQWTGKATGFASALVANPTASFTAVSLKPAWEGTVNIAGVGKTFLVSGELTFKRELVVIHTVDGTQAPYAVWQGKYSGAGKMKIVHEDDTELTRYLTKTKPIVIFDFTDGAGAGLTQFKVTMSKCDYTLGEVKRGDEYVSSEYTLEALANTTDVGASGGYSPAKIQLQNAKPANTY